MGIFDFLGVGGNKADDPCVLGEESIMSPKAHGSSNVPVQENLRWDCDRQVADNICNFNRYVWCIVEHFIINCINLFI